MKKACTAVFATAVILLACGKDKFQTKPGIQVIELSSKTIPVNGNLTITLQFTDKEGDVSDSLFLIKNRLNRRAVATVRDTLKYKIPAFPNKSIGEMRLNLNYTALQSAQNPPNVPGSSPVRKESDSLNLKIFVQDKAGNNSDTLTIPDLVILRQ